MGGETVRAVEAEKGNNNTVDSPESQGRYTDADYQAAALFLSRSCPVMKTERENIRKWQSGEKVFTSYDALAELISITPQGDDGTGVRVQTSNTSNQTARVGELLASGYAEKRQKQIMQELYSPEMIWHIAYLDWKIDIVKTAMAERMTKLQRSIYAGIFFFGKTYSQMEDESIESMESRGCRSSRKKLVKRKINLEKSKALDGIAMEIKSSSSGAQELQFLDTLMDEVRREQKES